MKFWDKKCWPAYKSNWKKINYSLRNFDLFTYRKTFSIHDGFFQNVLVEVLYLTNFLSFLMLYFLSLLIVIWDEYFISVRFYRLVHHWETVYLIWQLNLLISVSDCSCGKYSSNRIVGGFEAAPNAFPHQVKNGTEPYTACFKVVFIPTAS